MSDENRLFALEALVKGQIEKYSLPHLREASKVALDINIPGVEPLDPVISVYVEDLSTGAWMGVNHELQVPSASTIKVPLMLMAVLEDDGNGILSDTVSYTGEFSMIHDRRSKLLDPKNPNDKVSVRNLVRHMIVYSDSEAADELVQYLGQGSVNGFFEEQGLSHTQWNDWFYPSTDYHTNTTSARDISSIMRRIAKKEFDSLTQQAYDFIMQLLRATVHPRNDDVPVFMPMSFSSDRVNLYHKLGLMNHPHDMSSYMSQTAIVDGRRGRYVQTIMISHQPGLMLDGQKKATPLHGRGVEVVVGLSDIIYNPWKYVRFTRETSAA